MTLKSEYPTPLSHSITIAFELKQETYGRWYGKEKRTGRRPELVHKFVFGVDYGKTGLNWVKNMLRGRIDLANEIEIFLKKYSLFYSVTD